MQLSIDRDPRLITGACLESGVCVYTPSQVESLFLNYSLCLLASKYLSCHLGMGRPPFFTIQTASLHRVLSVSTEVYYIRQGYITPKKVAFLHVILYTKRVSYDSCHNLQNTQGCA